MDYAVRLREGMQRWMPVRGRFLPKIGGSRPSAWGAMALQRLHGISAGVSLGRMVVVANGLLLCLIAFSAAHLTWRLIPAPIQVDAPSLTQSETVATNGGMARAQTPPALMAGWHLFGERNATPTEPTETAPAPVVTLPPLILRGVIASGDRNTARAIIADPSGTEAFYALGAQVPGGAVVSSVQPNHVVLLVNGSQQTLPLASDDGSGMSAPLPSGMPSSMPMMPTPMFMQGAPPSLGEMRDSLVRDPRKLGDIARPVPVIKDGRFSGYRLLPGKDPQVLERVGLQGGDVVVEVNGQTLNNAAQGMALLRNLPIGEDVRLEIMRNGSPISVAVRWE